MWLYMSNQFVGFDKKWIGIMSFNAHKRYIKL